MNTVSAVSANLDLSRELYTHDQRKRFYADYEAAIIKERLVYKEIEAHLRANPVGWRFWKRPPLEWRETRDELVRKYANACIVLDNLKTKNALLVELFEHKHQPLI